MDGTMEPAHAPMPTLPESESASLQDLRLEPGLVLSAQPLRHPKSRYELTFLGLMGGKGVLVEPLGVACLREGLKAGEPFHVHGFTGEFDFGFETQVVRVFDFTFREPPLAYALLAYPPEVSARRVRRARRVRTSVPGQVALAGDPASMTAATVRDLSVAGALLETRAPLGATGTEVVLRLVVDFEGEALELVLPAIVCRSDAGPDGNALSGVLFQDLLRPDKLGLHWLVATLG
jgi:hypothetical protein